MMIAYSATDVRIFYDEIEVRLGTPSGGSIGTLTLNTLTFGVLVRSTIVGAFPGSIIVAACGQNGVPDMGDLNNDWKNGLWKAIGGPFVPSTLTERGIRGLNRGLNQGVC